MNALSAWEQNNAYKQLGNSPALLASLSCIREHLQFAFQGRAGGSVCLGLSGEGHISFPGLFTLVWSFLPLITNKDLGGGFPCFHGGYSFLLSCFLNFSSGEELPFSF